MDETAVVGLVKNWTTFLGGTWADSQGTKSWPAFWRGTFKSPLQDGIFATVGLRTSGLSSGSAWVNGHNLGRFSGNTLLYVPESWLTDNNTVVIYDASGNAATGVKLEYIETRARYGGTGGSGIDGGAGGNSGAGGSTGAGGRTGAGGSSGSAGVAAGGTGGGGTHVSGSGGSAANSGGAGGKSSVSTGGTGAGGTTANTGGSGQGGGGASGCSCALGGRSSGWAGTMGVAFAWLLRRRRRAQIRHCPCGRMASVDGGGGCLVGERAKSRPRR
jgi:MYXO-CTERM domain-containing protein